MRKSAFRTVLAAAIISTMLTVSAFAETGTITGSDVNFRSGPGTGYSVNDCLDKGTTVTVNDRSNSDWYSVTYNGQNGYVSSRYVMVNEEPSAIIDANSGTGYVNGMYVNFRSGASTDASIIGTYNKGKAVNITGTSGDWTACTIDGTSGYMFSVYISVDAAEAPSPAPTEEPQPEAPPQQPEAPVVDPVESKSGYINGDYVNFRTGTSTGSSIIANYNRGKEVTITGISGTWTACTIDGKDGFVFSSYVVENQPSQPTEAPAQTTGYIQGTTVRFRAAASLSAEILGEYNTGKQLTITGTSGDWTACSIDGTSGYVYSQYVTTDAPYVPTASGGSELGREIADFALQYVGYPYVYGGKSPSTGFDCSGLMYYTYGQFGYQLNRVACDQQRNGVHVERADAQPGDIVLFYNSGSDYIGHAGMYIGDGKFVHASSYNTGVIISELDTGTYSYRLADIRHIIE